MEDKNERIQDGYEFRIWISKEEIRRDTADGWTAGSVDVDEAMDLLMEAFAERYDNHGPDEQCLISWSMSGGPTYTTQAEIDEFEAWLASLPDPDEDEETEPETNGFEGQWEDDGGPPVR